MIVEVIVGVAGPEEDEQIVASGRGSSGVSAGSVSLSLNGGQ